MLKLVNLRVALSDERKLEEIISRKLKISLSDVSAVKILRKALDARHKDRISFVYTVAFCVPQEALVLKRLAWQKDLSAMPEEQKEPDIIYGKKELTGQVIVVGAGPAGLIAALVLAEHGYRPLLLERGLPIEQRVLAVADFWRSGKLSTETNVQFGQGGAGAFSDGKLTTRVNDPAGKMILEWFVEAGAPTEILYQHKPHVGTDMLRGMVKGLSERIVNNGGRIMFSSRLDDFVLQAGGLQKIVLSDGQKLDCGALVLAIGHSARDTYRMLLQRGMALEAKPFSIGVRIEHPQDLIDRAQYGSCAGNEKLGAADYSLVYHDKATGKSAYSFCMCPGGVVVASASGEGEVVTNGMSLYKRDSGIANSALAVGVSEQDFGTHPLAGMDFQQHWERLAFVKAGGDYYAPAQTVGSFLYDKKPVLGSLCPSTYEPGVRAASLRDVLPKVVADTLVKGFAEFERKIRGFASEEALLTGVETRTSAPVRILRSPESRQSINVAGIYPTGEGAGYAGGIMSAAMDGYYSALALMKEYKQPI